MAAIPGLTINYYFNWKFYGNQCTGHNSNWRHMRSFLLLYFIVLLSSPVYSQASDPKDSSKTKELIYEIKSLTRQAASEKYGLTPEQPVKVGKGPKSGPANQRDYLDLLRDGQENKITYERLGSCCPYESENGFMGLAMVDRYEVKYKDKSGKNRKTVIYISFYDYEEPLIPVGFSSESME